MGINSMKERIFYFSDVGKAPMYFMLSFVLFLKEVKTKTLQKKQLRSLKWTAAPCFIQSVHRATTRSFPVHFSFPSLLFPLLLLLSFPFPFLLPLFFV